MKLSTLVAFALPVLGAMATPITEPEDSAIQVLDKRALCTNSRYCLTGWSEKGYKGKSLSFCCYWGQCCSFPKLFNTLPLRSAKVSGVAGVYLYTDTVCAQNNKRLLVGQEGNWDLTRYAQFHSVNMDG